MQRMLWLAALALVCVAGITTIGAAGAQGSGPTLVSDSQLNPTDATVGGAAVLPTTRTVQHWFGTTANPNDGVTYGYNMVGADPNNCSGSGCSATVGTDIIPINVVVDGLEFDGTSVVTPVLDSPVFTTNDYSSTSASTSSAGGFTSGGQLSLGNTAQQLEDATMRSQFNQVGSSPYHLLLGTPVVHDPITIDVPSNQGALLESGRGVIFPSISIKWWAAKLQNLNKTLPFVDPTRLPIYLTDETMLFEGSSPLNCCVIGFHGAALVPGHGGGSTNGNGNEPVQTYAWASYVTPGTFNPTADWALQDIHALSHEISEWADDPFANNTVEPWLTPTAPQYGCTSLLETGDPVVGIGFSKGTNTFEQGPAPNGQQIADGTYHPEDEVFLPWFMRSSPNTISQPTQSPSTNVGRYTFMGNLNPYSGFQQPATGCS